MEIQECSCPTPNSNESITVYGQGGLIQEFPSYKTSLAGAIQETVANPMPKPPRISPPQNTSVNPLVWIGECLNNLDNDSMLDIMREITYRLNQEANRAREGLPPWCFSGRDD